MARRNEERARRKRGPTDLQAALAFAIEDEDTTLNVSSSSVPADSPKEPADPSIAGGAGGESAEHTYQEREDV